jgi:hypothetical protein
LFPNREIYFREAVKLVRTNISDFVPIVQYS